MKPSSTPGPSPLGLTGLTSKVRNTVCVVLDAFDGAVEDDAVAEFVGHPDRDLLGSGGEVILLGAAFDVEHQVQPSSPPAALT